MNVYRFKAGSSYFSANPEGIVITQNFEITQNHSRRSQRPSGLSELFFAPQIWNRGRQILFLFEIGKNVRPVSVNYMN